jgi:hypothetical protein
VLLRPSVICFDTLFDPNNPDKRGTLVTPYLTGTTADLPNGTPNQPLVNVSALLSNPSLATLVGNVKQGCLPAGRYAINVVYPDGQAWTVPNEAGSCAGPNSAEGATDFGALTCTVKPRPLLYSQGNRAVIEITPTASCGPNGTMTVPPECLPQSP